MENLTEITKKINNISSKNSVYKYFAYSSDYDYDVGVIVAYMADVFMNYDVSEEIYDKILEYLSFINNKHCMNKIKKFKTHFPTMKDFEKFILLKTIIG